MIRVTVGFAITLVDVEAPAEPNLDNCGVGSVLCKQHKHDGRVKNLEDGDRLPGIGRTDAPDRLGERIIVDQHAAARCRHPVALMPVDQVRRGVNMDGLPRRFEQRPRKMPTPNPCRWCRQCG